MSCSAREQPLATVFRPTGVSSPGPENPDPAQEAGLSQTLIEPAANLWGPRAKKKPGVRPGALLTVGARISPWKLAFPCPAAPRGSRNARSEGAWLWTRSWEVWGGGGAEIPWLCGLYVTIVSKRSL